MYTGKYPRWFTDNALGLRPRALSETTSRIFPVYTGYLGYNLYIYTTCILLVIVHNVHVHVRGAPFTLMKHDGALALLDMCCVALPCLFV